MDPFFITLIILIVTTTILALVRRLNVDKCLKDFEGDPVVLELNTGKILGQGHLRNESTGIELIHEYKHASVQVLGQFSTLFYKYEFQHIQAIVRQHEQLQNNELLRRNKTKERMYRPKLMERTRRKMNNAFKTLKDALNEIVNLFFAHFQSKNPYFKSSNKFVSQMNTEIIESVGMAFDPLLERYIGHKVVFDIQRGDEIEQYSGILKEYTTQFLEFWDVNYLLNGKYYTSDIIVPQQIAVVRHLAENLPPSMLQSFYKKMGRIIPDTLQKNELPPK